MSGRTARRRRWWLLGALLTAITLGAHWHWHAFLDAQGIVALDWQGLEFASGTVQLARLDLHHIGANGAELALHAESVRLDLPSLLRLQPPTTLRLARLAVRAEPALRPASAPDDRTALPTPGQLTAWLLRLPRHLRIDALDLDWPCAAARCQAAGSVNLHRPEADRLPVRLDLHMTPGAHRLALQATLDGTPAQARLDAQLTVDGQPRLRTRQYWLERSPSLAWNGSLILERLPELPALLAGVAAWLPQPLAAAPVRPVDLRLGLGWALQFPDALLPAAQGTLHAGVDVQIETPSGEPLALGLYSAPLHLDGPRRTLSVPEARLMLQGATLHAGPLALQEARAELRLSGALSAQSSRLHSLSGSALQLGRLAHPALTARDLRAPLEALSLTLAPDLPAHLSGPLHLTVGQLLQPNLHPQAWRWDGQLDTDFSRAHLDGRLSNAAALQLTTRLDRRPDGHLHLEATLPETFLRAGNPLAATLTAWPALLSLNTGRLQLNGTLDLKPSATRPVLTAHVQANGLGGIYDRLELHGLDTELALRLDEHQLTVAPLTLRLEQLDPGVVSGPLVVRGQYLAPADRPAAGLARWQDAALDVLGGRLWSPAGTLDLSAPSQTVALQLVGLDLNRLLEAYPAEGLHGSGLIDGQFTLRHGSEGITLERGTLAARAPGGQLRFDSPRLQALGQANPALALVVRALADFQYDLLTGDVRYAEQGKLTLGLRLHGHNPAFEKGRPVHFEIGLEEDLPALLTSLQLSDRVNDTIRRRVQERLQSGGSPSAAAP